MENEAQTRHSSTANMETQTSQVQDMPSHVQTGISHMQEVFGMEHSSSAKVIQRWWKRKHLCYWCKMATGYEDCDGMCPRCYHVDTYWDVIECEHGCVGHCC